RHLAEERALAEVRERDLLEVRSSLVDPHPAFHDDEEAAAWIALADDQLPRGMALVAEAVHQGHEGLLGEIVEERHLLRRYVRRRGGPGRRDVIEGAIEIVLSGGGRRRFRGARAGELLVGADREQLDLLLRPAGEQVGDRAAFLAQRLSRDHFLVLRAGDQVLGLRREDRIVRQQLRLSRRQRRIELQLELPLLRKRLRG